MKTANLIKLFVVTLVLSACGNKETPLTAEQKAELKAVGSSVNNAISAPGSTSTVARKGISAFGVQEFLKATENTSTSKTQLASRLEADCTIEQPDLSKDFNPSSFNMGWNVSGAKCPISMSVSMNGGASSSSGEVSFTFKYVVNDEEYKKLAQVASVEISGKISGSQNSAHVDVEGTIVSLSHGKIGLKITGNGSSDSGEIHVNISMKDYSAHLKITVESGGKQKYELNGEEISQSEMQSYMN